MRNSNNGCVHCTQHAIAPSQNRHWQNWWQSWGKNNNKEEGKKWIVEWKRWETTTPAVENNNCSVYWFRRLLRLHPHSIQIREKAINQISPSTWFSLSFSLGLFVVSYHWKQTITVIIIINHYRVKNSKSPFQLIVGRFFLRFFIFVSFCSILCECVFVCVCERFCLLSLSTFKRVRRFVLCWKRFTCTLCQHRRYRRRRLSASHLNASIRRCWNR